MNKKPNLKYHHLGILTNKPIEGEVYLKDYKVYHYGYEKSEYGIEWMRYEVPLLNSSRLSINNNIHADEVHF